MPKTKAFSEDYDTNYLMEVCGGGDDYTKGTFSKRFYQAVNLAQVKSGENVLDVGGGRGEISILCASKGAKVTTIDYSPAAVALTKSKIKHYPLFKNRISAQIMDAKTLKYKDGSFDKIFLLEVIEHLNTKETSQVLNEILRVLKPEGILIISTSPNKLLMDLLLSITKLFLGNKQWKSRKYHINEQSFFSLKKLFKNYGISYKIYLEEGKGFFYEQIKNNSDLSPKVKNFIKIFNDFYDFRICRLIKSLPLLNIIFCTSFLIEVSKAEKK